MSNTVETKMYNVRFSVRNNGIGIVATATVCMYPEHATAEDATLLIQSRWPTCTIMSVTAVE